MDPTITVAFQGWGSAPELWGSEQANFLVVSGGRRAVETGVFLNEPACTYLAEVLGQEDTQLFRHNAVRFVGQLMVERLAERGERIPPFVTISRATFEQDPELVVRIRRLTGQE